MSIAATAAHQCMCNSGAELARPYTEHYTHSTLYIYIYIYIYNYIYCVTICYYVAMSRCHYMSLCHNVTMSLYVTMPHSDIVTYLVTGIFIAILQRVRLCVYCVLH